MPQPAVRCQGITKTFGDGGEKVVALRGVDLEIRESEVFMLVGPSGCGKTTLISIMAGTLDHDGGECIVFGQDLRAMKTEARNRFRAENVGFVFQAFHLLPTLTAQENAAVPLFINGVKRKRALEIAAEMMEKVGLGPRMRGKPAQLSGGQQQRVAIARALVHQPRLIVCDEPTSALDHQTGERVMALLCGAAKEQGSTLVVVTHDARIFHYADRMALMDDGRITRVADDPKHIYPEGVAHG